MKKLFTIISVASMMLTSVFGFTSCQKDEMPATISNTQSSTPASDTFSFTIHTECTGLRSAITKAEEQMKEFYGSLVSGIKDVKYDAATKTITGKKSAMDEVVNVLKKADYTSIKSSLDECAGLISVKSGVVNTCDVSTVYAYLEYRPQMNTKDTSYMVGTWSATVDGTEYKLVISKDSQDDKYSTEYKATCYVGDEVYEGKYTALWIQYGGSFESTAKINQGNKVMTWLIDITLSENNLNEFTAGEIEYNGTVVGEDVKFVKQ